MQIRNGDRVTEFRFIYYYIKDPISWRSHCEDIQLVNYDLHEIRDWRLANRPTYSQWLGIRYRYGRMVTRYGIVQGEENYMLVIFRYKNLNEKKMNGEI